MCMDPIIKLEGIWKLFGKVIALEAISLQLYPGEVHCLLGDNGAGKSTLIKILSGVHSQTRGRFLFEGKTIVLITHEPDIAQYAKRVVHVKDGVIQVDEQNNQKRVNTRGIEAPVAPVAAG